MLTFDPAKQKYVKVGELRGNTLFMEKSRKHFMRVLDGYGIQESAFRELRLRGVQWIVILELETGLHWKVKLKDWFKHSKVADYGNGKQRFLSMKFMHQFKPTAPTYKLIDPMGIIS